MCFLPLKMMMLLAFLDRDSISKFLGLNGSSGGLPASIGWVEARLLELPFNSERKMKIR
jgi:hypothetical protein